MSEDNLNISIEHVKDLIAGVISTEDYPSSDLAIALRELRNIQEEMGLTPVDRVGKTLERFDGEKYIVTHDGDWINLWDLDPDWNSMDYVCPEFFFDDEKALQLFLETGKEIGDE